MRPLAGLLLLPAALVVFVLGFLSTNIYIVAAALILLAWSIRLTEGGV